MGVIMLIWLGLFIAGRVAGAVSNAREAKRLHLDLEPERRLYVSNVNLVQAMRGPRE